MELRTEPAVAHDLPAIGCGFGVVDDDRRGRALTGGFLVFIGPPSVVSHGIALEQGRIPGRKTRVVDQDEDRFAPDVHIRVVIPAVFGGNDAVAHEHKLAGFDPGIRHGAAGSRHHLILIFHQPVATFEMECHLHRVRIRLDRYQIDGLQVTLIEQRLQTHGAESRFDEIQRHLLAL